MKNIRVGENWQALNEDINSVHSGAYGRLSWDKPTMTITTRFDTPAGGRFCPRRGRFSASGCASGS